MSTESERKASTMRLVCAELREGVRGGCGEAFWCGVVAGHAFAEASPMFNGDYRQLEIELIATKALEGLLRAELDELRGGSVVSLADFRKGRG